MSLVRNNVLVCPDCLKSFSSIKHLCSCGNLSFKQAVSNSLKLKFSRNAFKDMRDAFWIKRALNHLLKFKRIQQKLDVSPINHLEITLKFGLPDKIYQDLKTIARTCNKPVENTLSGMIAILYDTLVEEGHVKPSN